MAKKNENTDFPKLALYIAGGFLLYKLVKKVGGFIQDPTGTQQESDDFESEIDVNKANLTYPEFQYTSWANALEQTLLVDSTENETLIDGIIYQMQNDDDWKQLVKSFGIRINYVLGYVPTGSYTLPGALLEFTPERINDYNNHFAGWNMQSRI
jgi:hypothetical protein